MVRRPAAVLALLLTWVAWPAMATGPQSERLDARVDGTVRVATPRDPCRLWTPVEQLARQAGLVAGFESARGCAPAPTTLAAGDDALVFEGATPREMLDALVASHPAFAWDVRDGVIVFRPTAASGGETVLDRPVAPFRVRGVHVLVALQALLRSASPSIFEPHERGAPSVSATRLIDPGAVTRIDAPIDVSFAGGTLIDALNAVARAVGGTWQAAYVNDRLHISVQTLVYGEGVTSVVSARLQ